MRIFPDGFKLQSFTYISRFVLFIMALSTFVFKLQFVEYFICVYRTSKIEVVDLTSLDSILKHSIVVSTLTDSQYKRLI